MENKEGRIGDSSRLIALRNRPYDGKIAGLYDLEETLGRGHFAVVKLARHVFTGEKVAVKVIDKSKLDDVSKAHLFQEVRCMKLVQHPNVVRLYEVIDTATKLYLVLELGDGGDLYEYILKHEKGLPEKVAKEYFSQIVRAISYCHRLHVVHRDLKPENVVFFKKQGVVKLTDFGFSNKFHPGQKLETSCGSLAYSAPEILLGDSYDAPAVDIWSLGVILYMLVCGQPPFQEANDSETLTMIMDCKYDVPPTVSESCRNLISRMLVRNPEKRASLAEIMKHPWLSSEKQCMPDILPLVSKERLLEEDHNLIVQKIENGHIATKEEIQYFLEKNEYNHITATYYLLAERKLRAKRQEQMNKNKRPEQLAVTQGSHEPEKVNCLAIKPCMLNVPRTPGDLPQKLRKCSIVQEDEEGEGDMSSCSGGEELGPPLNRRGSRSEGHLHLSLQEKIAEMEKSKPVEKVPSKKKYPHCHKQANNDKDVSCHNATKNNSAMLATVCDPVATTNLISGPQLNEIFEDAELLYVPDTKSGKFVNHNQVYEQRKKKNHKKLTTSCSSSDASDDDSEKRKKQAQKITESSKLYKGRRDSYDDSSDSQEPDSGCARRSGNNHLDANSVSFHSNKNSESQKQKTKTSNYNSNGRKHTVNSNMLIRARQKVGKRKNRKHCLTESQSLNRISEVQEDGSQPTFISTTIFSIHGTLTSKVKNVSNKIFQSSNKTLKKSGEKCTEANSLHISRVDTPKASHILEKQKENCGIKNYRALGKYFQIHKKICLPLPTLFSKSNLYKAQSCSSIAKKKITYSSETLKCKEVPHSIIKNDVNQNKSNEVGMNPSKIDLNNVCNEFTEICAIHIGHASKCCSSF